MNPLPGHWLSGPADPKRSPVPEVQLLASALDGSSCWKEQRIMWASLTQRWPKALLYHSGDLPLQQETAHITTEASPASPASAREVCPHLRSTLEMCVSRVLPVPQGSRRYWESSTTPLTAPVRGLSSCSTDTHTSAQEPLHRSVRHDLRTWRTKKKKS